MRPATSALLLAVSTLATTCVAVADDSSVGLTITSDRNPSNFAIPKDIKYQFNGAHTFRDGLILGGSFQYVDPTFRDGAIQNLEGTIGYQVRLNSAFSLTGSAGIGERWREDPSASFPYYVLRTALDFALNQDITWNVISYRFRDAFDSNDDYHTPQVATGVTFKLDAQSSISAKIMRNWREGQSSSTGVSLGFNKSF